MPTAKASKVKAVKAEAPAEAPVKHLMGSQGSGQLRNHVTAIAPANWTPESVLRAHGLWMF
jgi:hypothetical protein